MHVSPPIFSLIWSGNSFIILLNLLLSLLLFYELQSFLLQIEYVLGNINEIAYVFNS